jgi:NAD(P)-dependent dehydrogenase (short-subunit alcohol dehydrogenase family)
LRDHVFGKNKRRWTSKTRRAATPTRTYEGRVRMNHFARPEDVAHAVACLADPDQSTFVNGHAMSVDGGWFGDGG